MLWTMNIINDDLLYDIIGINISSSWVVSTQHLAQCHPISKINNYVLVPQYGFRERSRVANQCPWMRNLLWGLWQS